MMLTSHSLRNLYWQTAILLWMLLVMLQVVHGGYIERQPTYTVLAPTVVRPNQDMRIAATVIRMESETVTVTTVVKLTSHDGKHSRAICDGKHTFNRPGSYGITMRTPTEMSPGNYSLIVSGYSDTGLTGQIFNNETELFYDNKQVSVFIITSKPYYNKGETVEIKIIPIRRNRLPISESMDIRIKDPIGNAVREWFSQHTNAGGIVSIAYKLNSLFPRYGEWTIEVDCLNQVYTKHFIIDEWYLPIRFVNISMPTSMISSDFGIAGIGEAKWTTHRPVVGNATITLDILSAAKGQSYEPITRKLDYFDGSTEFVFTRQEMEEHAGGPNSLVGKELKVTLSVQDWTANNTGSGSQSAVVYSKDIHLQFLEGSAITFKPDLPFSVNIAAQFGDGSPLQAHNPNRTIYLDIVESDDILGDESRSEMVKISLESVAKIWLNPGKTVNRFSITARYENKQDTRRTLVASRFWSPSNSYLHITTVTKNPQVEHFMNFNILTNTFVDTVYYAIISGGNIILSDQLEMHMRNKQLSIALSRDMVPTSIIIAYFITPDGQVVTDSLNFYVDGNSGYELTAKINRGKDLTYSSIELTLTADPLSYVAFGAMEYGLYNFGARNGLSVEEVTSELYTYDKYSNTSIYHTWEKDGEISGAFSAHTGSYGHDANSTFFYSGLYIFTDANVSSVYTHCNKSKGELPCMDGKTCYEYTDICTGKAECAADHQDEMGCFHNKTHAAILYNSPHWRTKGIRSFYTNPGFMWSEQYIKPNGRSDVSFSLPNYPTSWVVTALAMSREHGLTILKKPVLFDGHRPLYLRVEAPGSVELHEHASLSIVVYNRWVEPMDVLVTVKGSKDYTPINWDRNINGPIIGSGEHQVMLPVMPGSERQLYVPILMKRVGTIHVHIEAMSFVGTFKLTQKIKVFYEGVPEMFITNYQVDLRRANSERVPDLLIPVKEKIKDPERRILNYVAGSPNTEIHVVGDVIGVGFASQFNNHISGRGLLASPDYNAQNAIFSFAMDFYSLKTLRSLSRISSKQTDAVINSLNSGLQVIFSHMNTDGSFRLFRWSPEPNTWLTALILQILSEIKGQISDLHRKIQIPQKPLEKAALWLTSQQGLQKGSVREAGYVNNKIFESKLYVDVDGEKIPSNVSLTALCIIALSKTKIEESGTQSNLTDMKTFGADYISSLVPRIEDPFELSIVTYALTVIDHEGKNGALARLKEIKRSVNGMFYWSTSEMPPIEKASGLDTQLTLLSKERYNNTGYAVTATSYALLSYIDSSQSESDINSIQRFLQEQRMHVGGFVSTYDTLIAVQALTALAKANQDRSSYEMFFIFRSDQDHNWSKSIHLHRNNFFTPQKVSLPSHWGSVQTYVRGHGIALLQMKTTVNYEHQELFRKRPGKFFDINLSLTTSGFNHSLIHYKICPTWKGPGERSGLAVIDFTIPSGYAVPNGGTQKFCRKYSKTTSIRNGEARGSQITIYFEYFDRTQNNCYKINADRKRTVSNITEHHYIRVFDYFEPGIYNETLIDRIEFTKLTLCLTCGSYQCPHCPHYASSLRNMGNTNLIVASIVISVFIKYCNQVRNIIVL